MLRGPGGPALTEWRPLSALWYSQHTQDQQRRGTAGPALIGVVKVNEMLVDGKVKGKRHGYCGNKTIVAGANQRGGKVHLERSLDVKRPTVRAFIQRAVENEAEAICLRQV